jgi:hypothetical protein
MRGKKSDPAFIAQFITESVQKGIATPDQIVQRAKDQIAEIDEEIRAIEAKKILRSKLLDVVLNFEKATRDKTEEARLLPFFTLEYVDVCMYLCTLIKIQPIPANPMVFGESITHHKTVYAIKQLLERKIIARENDKLVRGERFDEYMKFVYQEA